MHEMTVFGFQIHDSLQLAVDWERVVESLMIESAAPNSLETDLRLKAVLVGQKMCAVAAERQAQNGDAVDEYENVAARTVGSVEALVRGVAKAVSLALPKITMLDSGTVDFETY